MSSILKPVLGSQLNFGHPLSNGLVGLWPFNEGSGGQVFDLSGNGNAGTLVADTHWVPGIFGSCLYFDRVGDYVETNEADLFNSLPGITVSVLFKPDIVADNVNYALVSKWDGSAAGTANFLLQTKFSDGSQYTTWSTYNPGNIAVGYGWVTANPDWQHVVGVYDGSYMRLYYNGIEVGTPVAMTGNMPSSAVTLRIGDDNDNIVPFGGWIDNVAIWKCALTASEIALLYREPFCMFEREQIELLVGATSVGVPVGNAGIMTTNTGYWGPTF